MNPTNSLPRSGTPNLAVEFIPRIHAPEDVTRRVATPACDPFRYLDDSQLPNALQSRRDCILQPRVGRRAYPGSPPTRTTNPVRVPSTWRTAHRTLMRNLTPRRQERKEETGNEVLFFAGFAPLRDHFSDSSVDEKFSPHQPQSAQFWLTGSDPL